MAKVEVILPAMGEGIVEATVTRWIVEKGNKVEEDEAIVEIATDKVDSELPAPVTGTLTDIFFHEGEIPKVGQVIAIIQDDKKEEAPKQKPGIKDRSTQPEPENIKSEVKPQVSTPEPAAADNNKKFFSPYIRQLASDRNISVQELNLIKGTGKDNRITKDDLNRYIATGRVYKEDRQQTAFRNYVADSGKDKKEYTLQPGERMVEMDRTRKLIAQHMVESKHVAPHVSSTIEADVTNMVQWREKNKKSFFEKHGVKLTYTPIITLAVASAIKQHMAINVSVFDEFIIEKENINIGIATALNDGNLIVPVIKNADRLNLVALTLQVNDLSSRARQNKLLPAEIQRGTFTITNMGQFGNSTGFPIINQPQVAILAVGSIIKKPAVVYENNMPAIGIRDIMVLTMSYDHRVVDGALGGSFLKTISDYLINFPGDLINNIGI